MDLARIAFGVVFLFAGGAKLADQSWVASAAEFGLGSRTAWLVPATEIVLGSLIVTAVGGSLAIAAGIALLLAFTFAIITRLRAGRIVVCACFGGWSRRPLSWRSVARNGAFIALGLLAL